ncbi:hypothetical protein [Corallococcus sp. AB038B]|uniref:hypothetical protein n=1 Tax=Corallococcus sp. AB038B TaxID=2316718 RepID=UPI0011C45E07|nr:hypothetical protein [Corallococcus sp. AB038B]
MRTMVAEGTVHRHEVPRGTRSRIRELTQVKTSPELFLNAALQGNGSTGTFHVEHAVVSIRFTGHELASAC